MAFAHCRTSVPRDGGSLSGKTHSMDSMQHALIKNIDPVPSLEHVQLPLRRFCRFDRNSARVLSHAFGLTLAKGAAQVVPFVLIARRFGRGCSCKPCVRQCLEILLKGKEWKTNERNGNQTKVPLTSMIHRVSTDGSLHQVDRSFCRREKGARKVTLKAQKGKHVSNFVDEFRIWLRKIADVLNEGSFLVLDTTSMIVEGSFKGKYGYP